jgi:hypothetical protein
MGVKSRQTCVICVFASLPDRAPIVQPEGLTCATFAPLHRWFAPRRDASDTYKKEVFQNTLTTLYMITWRSFSKYFENISVDNNDELSQHYAAYCP